MKGGNDMAISWETVKESVWCDGIVSRLKGVGTPECPLMIPVVEGPWDGKDDEDLARMLCELRADRVCTCPGRKDCKGCRTGGSID